MHHLIRLTPKLLTDLLDKPVGSLWVSHQKHLSLKSLYGYAYLIGKTSFSGVDYLKGYDKSHIRSICC